MRASHWSISSFPIWNGAPLWNATLTPNPFHLNLTSTSALFCMEQLFPEHALPLSRELVIRDFRDRHRARLLKKSKTSLVKSQLGLGH